MSDHENAQSMAGSQDPPIDLGNVKEQAEKKARADLKEKGGLVWKWTGIIIGVIFLIIIGAIVISGISNAISNSGFTMFGWFSKATINPGDKEGFSSLIKLILSAAFILLGIEFIRYMNRRG